MKKPLKNIKGKVSRLWKSYSMLLTFCLVCAITVSGVSAAKKYTIENGLLKTTSSLNSSSWQNVTWGAPSNPNNVSQSALDAMWSQFAEDTGIASQAGGGLTLAELRTGLQEYVGKRVSSYSFLTSNPNSLDSVTVADLYEAIALNQVYSTKPLYSSNLKYADYLSEDGVILGTTAVHSITDTARAGFAGMARIFGGKTWSFSHNLVGSDSATYTRNGLSTALSVLLSDVTYNQVEIAKIEQQMLDMQQQIKDLNEQWYTTLNKSLVGTGSSSYTPWNSSTGEPGEDVTYTDVLTAITQLGGDLQNDLAKLRYVLASDKDIEMAEKQEPVKDSIADNFTGDSNAAVKPGDVDSMAGVSGSLQDSFNTGANANDVFGAINGSENWSFWSQESASDLNAVPATMSDDDENFIHFYDPSVLDEYLSGGDAS